LGGRVRAMEIAFLILAVLAAPPKERVLKLPPAIKAMMIDDRSKLAAEKRAQAIKLLEELIAMNPGPEAASDALYKLAQLYWEDARQKYAVAMAELEKGKAPQPKLDVPRSEKLYGQIIEKYPKFKHPDIVLSLLGFGAQESGRGDEGVKWLPRLID